MTVRPLTRMELHVLTAIVEHGGGNSRLAKLLSVSVGTVKTHKHNIAVKFGTNNLGSSTSASVAIAFRSGLLNGAVCPFSLPSPEYRSQRQAAPYTARYADGSAEEMHTWGRRLPEEMSTE
jgi:DNA-binding CsgD family transcriptional regulator